ncbi:MAG TPA: iron-containing alcohol dehydrogenase [Candidatus Binataceae bacterium]|nr:iron-containing alcohol dehydrogenase [Candidatus Binataceae bacterium]
MRPIVGEYNFTRLETVIYGPGKISTLWRELSKRNARRAVIVTSKTLGRSRLLDKVKEAAGSALAGVFAETSQHVPSKTVEALVAEARRLKADSFVSFGGGTPNDTAKGAANVLLGGKLPSGIDLFATPAPANPNMEFPEIAIPTTLSAGEFTPFAGMTHEETREKGGVGEPRLQAKAVILDPEVTVETPAWLWAGTAMRALDHAVEGAYSNRHTPITDALAARAIKLLNQHLKPSLQTNGEEEMYHRGQCQLAAWMSIFGALNTRFGISHALGHQIGPVWDVPHGFTSCITLPHAMRFMAEISPQRFEPIADGFGIRFDPENPRLGAYECADRVAQFIRQFEVPNRLRDVEVPRSELSRIANTVLHEISRSHTVDREVTLEDLNKILEAAY